MQDRRSLPKIVSSSEAQSRFGKLMKRTTENQDTVVVKLHGKPGVVVMSYKEYKEVEKLRKREQNCNALGALDALRCEVQRQNPDVTAEDAYRFAGFSEEVIWETFSADEELTATKSSRCSLTPTSG